MHVRNRCNPLLSLLLLTVSGSIACSGPADLGILAPTIPRDSTPVVVPMVPEPVAPPTFTDSAETPADTTGSTPTVTSPGLLAWSDFSDGTISPFTNPWSGSGAVIDVADDPTGGGRGKVARIHYAPMSGASHELALAYVSATPVRYGQTLWMTGDVLIRSGFANQGMQDYRKLIDWQGNGCRIVLSRVDALRRLQFDTYDYVGGALRKTTDWTEVAVPDDQWTRLEVRLTLNSADDVQDGVIEVYVNGAATPEYRRGGFSWITDAPVGEWSKGSYFNTFLAGSQLTSTLGTPGYEEDRYWDKLGYGTSRLR